MSRNRNHFYGIVALLWVMAVGGCCVSRNSEEARRGGTMAKSGVEMDYPYTDEDVEFAVGRLSQVKRMLPNKTGVILDRLGLHRGAGSWMLLREDVIVGKVFRIYKLSPKYMLVVVRPLFQGQDLLRMANTPWVDTELVEDFRIVPAESEE